MDYFIIFLAVRLRPSLCVIWLQLNGKGGGSGPSDWGRDEPCGHSEENDMSRFMDGRQKSEEPKKIMGKRK